MCLIYVFRHFSKCYYSQFARKKDVQTHCLRKTEFFLIYRRFAFWVNIESFGVELCRSAGCLTTAKYHIYLLLGG